MSSSAHVPLNHSDEANTICGQSSDSTDAGYYEFQWLERRWCRKTTNTEGTTGWVKIITSTNPRRYPVTQCRVHLCADNPCRAAHPASKYGLAGAPIHLQKVQQQIELSAVAEPSDSQLQLPAVVQSAVAGSSGEAPSPAAELVPAGAAPVVEPAPAEEPATALKQSVVLEPQVEADMAGVPDCPKEAALNNMKPPAPASPIHVDP